jgi:hypothetical protein
MIGQEYFWILECFESDVETENEMMVELPSAGVVASSWDYIFKNYEDARICADSLTTKESKTSRKREKGERNHRWVVESHWLKEVPVKWCTGKNLRVL